MLGILVVILTLLEKPVPGALSGRVKDATHGGCCCRCVASRFFRSGWAWFVVSVCRLVCM